MAKNRKSSSRKTKKSMKTYLHSKFILYLSLILFIFNILAFLFFKDMQSLFLLLIVLSITYMFDQNMIVVLMVPMLFVGTLIILRKTFMERDLVEGMSNSSGQKQQQGSGSGQQQGSMGQGQGQGSGSGQQQGSMGQQPGSMGQQQQGSMGQQQQGSMGQKQQGSMGQKGGNTSQQQGSMGQQPQAGTTNTESYSNIINNKDELKSNLNDLVNNYEKAQQEFSDTIENSNLDPQSLETQRLIAKQMNLITPVIKDTVGVLNKVDLNGLNKFIGSFGNLVGSLNNPLPVAASTKV